MSILSAVGGLRSPWRVWLGWGLTGIGAVLSAVLAVAWAVDGAAAPEPVRVPQHQLTSPRLDSSPGLLAGARVEDVGRDTIRSPSVADAPLPVVQEPAANRTANAGMAADRPAGARAERIAAATGEPSPASRLPPARADQSRPPAQARRHAPQLPSGSSPRPDPDIELLTALMRHADVEARAAAGALPCRPVRPGIGAGCGAARP